MNRNGWRCPSCGRDMHEEPGVATMVTSLLLMTAFAAVGWILALTGGWSR